MEQPDDTAANLTGVWQGLYTYWWGDEEAFVATLLHTGDALTGTTHETPPPDTATSDVVLALIDGSVEGGSVVFTKTYDGTGGWDHAVYYRGEVGDGGREITGTWVIPNAGVAGRFMMIRNTGKGKAVEREVERVV